MTNFWLSNMETAYNAAQWCFDTISKNDWSLTEKNILSKNPIYIFSFKNTKDAIVFALKWAS